MSLSIADNGHKNTVIISQESEETLSGGVMLDGDNNSLDIGPHCSSANTNFVLRNGSSVRIGHHCHLSHLQIYADCRASVEIGDHVGFNGHVRLQLHERGMIKIGGGSLFAGEIEVTISDMHSVIDLTTGERINSAHDIIIGERVWIGQRAMILKGATIGAGAVIGAGSIVTRGLIPENCVAAGNPAKVVKSHVSWRFELS